jgi:periplasmic protein TonB
MNGAVPAPLVALGARPSLARRRWTLLPVTIIVSIAAHLAVVALLVSGVPLWPRAAPPPLGEATVALIMEQAPSVQYGGKQGAPPSPPAPATPPAPPAPAPQQATTRMPPPAITPDAVPMPAPAVPMPPQPAQQSAARPSAPTEGDSNADVNLGHDPSFQTGIVTGSQVVPAKPDASFHNIPPRYPREAAIRHEQGAVTLLIHVNPTGAASSVDVVESSGYPVLDRTAQEAVMRWHFNPEQKDGIPVASELPFRIIFGLDQR